MPNPAFAGVSHIKSMEQSADDRFNVICLYLSLENCLSLMSDTQ